MTFEGAGLLSFLFSHRALKDPCKVRANILSLLLRGADWPLRLTIIGRTQLVWVGNEADTKASHHLFGSLIF